MKRYRQFTSQRGAAIVLTLVFIAGIAVIAISLLSISSQQARNSGYRAQAVRAELATDAAFEAAKNLLLGQTANDSYLVTTMFESDWSAEPPSRYTFLSRPGRDEIRHLPLFSHADGDLQTVAYPPDIHLHPLDGDGKSALAPTVTAFSNEAVRPFQLPPLTHLHPETGELVREDPRPLVDLLEMSNPDGDHLIQYAFWIEDLQGYPNLDVIGIPSSSSDDGHAIRWGGYSRGDARIDRVIKLDDYSLDAYRYEFPGVIAPEPVNGVPLPTQLLANQVAPGLSPRELPFFPWKTEQFTAAEHPYWRLAYLRANQHMLPSLAASVMLSQLPTHSTDQDRFAIDLEERYALGLRGYRHQPIIPFGHGYPNAGEPCLNVNELIHQASLAALDEDPNGVSNSVVELARHLEESLPNFVRRSGGFPEHYYRTLAATMIDYADEGIGSTVSAPGESEEESYRGIDSFPVVNEFFVLLELSEKPEDAGGGGPLTVTAQTWVELWNPTSQPIDLSNADDPGRDPQFLELSFEFVEPLSFLEADGTEHVLDEKKTFARRYCCGPDAPSNPHFPENHLPLEPNGYRMIPFGEVEWTFDVGKTPGLPWIFLGAAGPDGKDGRGHYELRIQEKNAAPREGTLVDQSGRSQRQTNTGFPDHGFHLSRFTDGPLYAKDYRGNRSDGQVRKGDAMMVATAVGLNIGDRGSNYGDSFMTYWTKDTQESEYYVNSASPGVRNFLRKLYKRSSKGGGRFDMEARPSYWPDGGFDSPTYNVPSSTSNSTLESILRTTSSDSANYVLPDNDEDYPSNGRLMPNLADLAKEAQQARTPAPFRISNQGRLFALSELGHLYDPIMWKPYGSATAFHYYERRSNSLAEFLFDITSSAQAETDPAWGGGNTLRIGRREHPRFDRMGERAVQLLDIFHVGVPGTNCELGRGETVSSFEVDDPVKAYASYDAMWHQPPPTASDAKEAWQDPYKLIYPVDLHASSPFEWIHGQLNINSIPTLFEMETFLQGVFSSELVKENPDQEDRDAEIENVREIFPPEHIVGTIDDFASIERLEHTLNTDPEATAVMGRHDPVGSPVAQKTIRDVARRLFDQRPYFSRSDLAFEIAEAVSDSRPTEGEIKASPLPQHRGDALSEEVAARILNTTTLSSRHFRIYTHGRVVTKRRTAGNGFVLSEGGELLARDSKVYEVFLEPTRDPNSGKILSTTLRILNVRSL